MCWRGSHDNTEGGENIIINLSGVIEKPGV